VADAQPQKAAELSRALDGYLKAIDAPLPRDNPDDSKVEVRE